MLNRIIEPPPLETFRDPDDWSRSRLLNILLVGVGVISLFFILLVKLDDMIEFPLTDQGTLFSNYIVVTIFLLGLLFLYWLNRRGQLLISSVLFLIFCTMALVFLEAPEHYFIGRGLVMYVVPILMSSFILRPYASFFMALGIWLLHTAIWYFAELQVPYNVFSLVVFMTIALVTWLAANSLQGALRQSRQVNQENEILIGRLQSMRQQLQQLTHQLIKVQEEERKLIAHELHDEIGQTLTAVHIILETMLRNPEAESNPTRIREASDAIQQMMAQVKDLLVLISPAELENLGLQAGLEHLVGTLNRQTGLEISLLPDGLEKKRFSSDMEITAYRIVQEALTNIVRHAEASEAQVRAEVEGQTLVLQVQDNGRGFELDAVQQAGISMGLTGMIERAERIGGDCRIESKPEAGTRVMTSLPLLENGEIQFTEDK